jgi:hypothetical protein
VCVHAHVGVCAWLCVCAHMEVWARVCVCVTLLYTPFTSLARGEMEWKPTPLSVTGDAVEGTGREGTGRDATVNSTVWRGEGLAHCLCRWRVNLLGGEAFTAIFQTDYCHLLFQNCNFS